MIRKAIISLLAVLVMLVISTPAFADTISVYYMQVPALSSDIYEPGTLRGFGVALTADVARCSGDILTSSKDTSPDTEGLIGGISCAIVYWPKGGVDEGGAFIGLGGGVWEESINYEEDYSREYLSVEAMAGAQWKWFEGTVRYIRFIASDNLQSAVSVSVGVAF
ncbi:MAG: hypothetical protein KAR83_04260 [Thermodesulfovibrionales bacterium]|nr:hypothetical protein [Thermodesulfovibrionales bacterium]